MWNNNELPFESYISQMLADKVKHQNTGSLIHNYADTFKIQYLGSVYYVSKRYASLEGDVVLFDTRFLQQY
jgi:hypothetical protein